MNIASYKKVAYLLLVVGLIVLPNKVNSVEGKQIKCTSCDLQRGKLTTTGGVIASTDYFEARQDYAIPIAGFVVISSKRHMQSVDEFTLEERHDFMDFLHELRTRMREKLEIQTVYLVQEEDASHFHVWLFPRYSWMNEFGRKIKSVKPIMKWSKTNLNTSENIEKVKEAVDKLR